MSNEITEAERVIMDALWSKHPLRRGEIVRQVASARTWHHKTVSTLIRRLVDKGIVGFEKGIGGFCYFPLKDKEDYRRGEAKRLVTELFDGKITPLLAAFVNSEKLSRSDLDELRKLVAKLDK